MSSRLLRRVFLAAIVFLCVVSAGTPALCNGQANFWIATNDNGPQAPLVEVLPGTVNSIDIWARPGPGLILGGFSLNLFSSNSAAITFQSVEVKNPTQTTGGGKRHQLIFDSSVMWELIEYDDEGEPIVIDRFYNDEHLEPDFIEDFFGATFVNDSDLESDGAGIGPMCNDNECMLINGLPSWKVATVTFMASDSLGSTDLFLEIGEQGIWHFGDETSSTTALFGDPADNDASDIHSWTPFTLGGHSGLPDAVIQVVSQLSDADFDMSDLVDGPDFLIWQRGYGTGVLHSQGNANQDETIDQTDLQIWQSQYGTAPAALTAVPEPSTVALQLAVAAIVLAGRTRCWLAARALCHC